MLGKYGLKTYFDLLIRFGDDSQAFFFLSLEKKIPVFFCYSNVLDIAQPSVFIFFIVFFLTVSSVACFISCIF